MKWIWIIPIKSVPLAHSGKKKKVERIRKIPFHGVAALGAFGIEQLTPPGKHLFYFSTGTLLCNPLNRHSLGLFNFFLPECKCTLNG